MKKLAAGLALAAFAATTGTACYGKFALTDKVYVWNGHATDNKFANSALFWALVIIPVYEVTLLADFIVINPIEVITGSNPVE
jgi:hypothetical protein